MLVIVPELLHQLCIGNGQLALSSKRIFVVELWLEVSMQEVVSETYCMTQTLN